MKNEFYREKLRSDSVCIVNYITNYRIKNVDSTIFSAIVQYEHWLGIYRSQKNQYKNGLEAFITLWTCSLVDIEEWHDHYESTTEFAEAIYKNFFQKDLAKYDFQDCKPDEAKEYIMHKVKRMTQNVKNNREKYPLNSNDIIYPNSIPGIYENWKIVNEDFFEFILTEKVIAAMEFYYNESWAGYKTLFLETEKEYIYFCE